MSTTQEQIEANEAEQARAKAEMAATLTTWPAFLALPFAQQQRIRELIPERLAQLERAHFRGLEV